MTRAQRRVHVAAWLLVALAATALYIAAMASRPPRIAPAASEARP